MPYVLITLRLGAPDILSIDPSSADPDFLREVLLERGRLTPDDEAYLVEGKDEEDARWQLADHTLLVRRVI
jgi:hypothetical protein